jgi:hypothetical protein
MPDKLSPAVQAARQLLADVVKIMNDEGAEAVLVGGWVPDIRYPLARPPHQGSLDVDLALRLDQASYARVTQVLEASAFRQGSNAYQFFKDYKFPNGRFYPIRLDLLTSHGIKSEHFSTNANSPLPVVGAELAFANHDSFSLPESECTEIRVAGLVAFITMKSLALLDRRKPKDAYDLHFCLEFHPQGVGDIAAMMAPHRQDPLVQSALAVLAKNFRDENDDGPRMVADMEGKFGEVREIRKREVVDRVQRLPSTNQHLPTVAGTARNLLCPLPRRSHDHGPTPLQTPRASLRQKSRPTPLTHQSAPPPGRAFSCTSITAQTPPLRSQIFWPNIRFATLSTYIHAYNRAALPTTVYALG